MAPSVEDRLARMEVRQEALIGAIGGLTDVMEQTRAMVAELATWLKQPPSNDLPDLIRHMTAALENNTDAIVTIGRLVNALPAELAQVVQGTASRP
jgi:hypothetical protein